MSTQENNNPEKKKKIWPIFLIAGIIAVIIFAVIVVVLVVAVGFGAWIVSVKNRPDPYSYSNIVDSMDMSKKPETVASAGASIYDYTLINDVLTKDTYAVEAWIKKYYPNCSVRKNVLSDEDETWEITSNSPMTAISIDGYVYSYDMIRIHITDGYAENILFINTNADIDLFNEAYLELEKKYGSTELYIPDEDLFTKIFEANSEYLSYSWMENDFDGFYYLALTRSQHSTYSETYIQFSKYY